MGAEEGHADPVNPEEALSIGGNEPISTQSAKLLKRLCWHLCITFVFLWQEVKKPYTPYPMSQQLRGSQLARRLL